MQMRRFLALLLGMCALCTTGGCSVEKVKTEKIREVEFTVLDEETMPQELHNMVQERKNKPFKVTYADGEALYIAQGYGSRPTSGYSVEVKECYETANAVCFHTSLIGPSREETIAEAETFPFVAVKVEFIDKNVVFE